MKRFFPSWVWKNYLQRKDLACFWHLAFFIACHHNTIVVKIAILATTKSSLQHLHCTSHYFYRLKLPHQQCAGGNRFLLNVQWRWHKLWYTTLMFFTSARRMHINESTWYLLWITFPIFLFAVEQRSLKLLFICTKKLVRILYPRWCNFEIPFFSILNEEKRMHRD